MPWKSQKVADHIDRLEKVARAAKLLDDKYQESGYEAATAGMYDQLRALWDRGVADVAFSHVVMRHRDYVNAKDPGKPSAHTEAGCDAYAAGFKKCCDVVNAHDSSGGRNAAPPPPADLFQDVQTLKDRTASLRDRQNKVL